MPFNDSWHGQNIYIRPETPDDYEAILRLTYEAFLTLDYPGRRRMDEHFLFHLLQKSSFVIPQLCFVAEKNGETAGHILYTKSSFKRAGGSIAETITFGPLSVLPKYQRQGIGRELVRHSMEKARAMGYGAVLIVGVPDYYPKLGFKRASEYDLAIADSSVMDAFMVYELVPEYLNEGGVYDGWAPEYDLAENDDAGFSAFHRRFIAEYFPGKLMLRSLFQNDVILVERWLAADHVKPWYERPDEWMNEIRNRYGKFSFLHYMIAEMDGVPVGFCQYYDCHDSLEFEKWDTHTPQGEVYSIDYLIGEPEFLGRGIGKEIVRQLTELIFKIPSVRRIIVEPDKENHASNGALLANGYILTGSYYERVK